MIDLTIHHMQTHPRRSQLKLHWHIDSLQRISENGGCATYHPKPVACMLAVYEQCGDRLYTSETDVCRRQILAYKDCPRTERK